MSTSAIILMVLIQGSVTIITIYFLLKVLRTPPPEADMESPDEEKQETQP